MIKAYSRINLQVGKITQQIRHELEMVPSWPFIKDVVRLIWEYKWYSLAIFIVTIFQEFAALWPVSLLGQFIDRLETGDMGNIVWLFMASSVFYPGLLRANVMLRHKMFYETDRQKLVELVLKASAKGDSSSPEAAGAAYTRAANAVSGITNAAYHILGSFTPVVIKIIIVSGSLLGYNRTLGLAYLGSLLVPTVMTIVFNKRLRVVLDSQYSVISETSGAAIKTISEKDNLAVKSRFQEIMRSRKEILINLVFKNQYYTYAREAALVGSQFLVVFMALAMREQISMTVGDFAKIIGYMAQVAAAFIGAASTLDAIISYSRAYHIYVKAGGD
ncbi:MAG: ABC transporter ATP-binding protein [Anaerolineae bacterium]|nr:ABC transporter ATP-binding protein [Anaerolineae bacterium]